jgi:putative membrane protein insertion efficiency factor
VTRGRNPIRALLVGAVRGYQMFVSPGLPGRCKYYPSCSQYAIDALTQYGVVRGFVLASWRLLRCNPLSYGGYDPVQHQTLFARRSVAPCVDEGMIGDRPAEGHEMRDPRAGTAWGAQ